MKERILEFLRAENKSSAQLAEEIGVQPSGISHILSGRNNPSLDFILKMLEKYRLLSTDWLLFGKGTMYKGNQMATLFDDSYNVNDVSGSKRPDNEAEKSFREFHDTPKDSLNKDYTANTSAGNMKVVKIVWFYENNSFEVYFPRN
jgi:transcriptional regulator with XRE-family HTH domain